MERLVFSGLGSEDTKTKLGKMLVFVSFSKLPVADNKKYEF
jgi:hypothetical protein